MSLLRLVLLGAVLAVSSACSTAAGDDGGVPDAGGPASLPRPPQVVDAGGPVLASPRIVPVFFAGDDPAMVAEIADFTSKIGATGYWASATAAYGVGAATALAPVVLAETAAANLDESDIAAWLLAKLDGGDPSFPAPDESTVYALHFPAGVTITRNGGASVSCAGFNGYHANVTRDAAHGGADVAYAVLPRCDDLGGLTGIDALTGPESHELAEAATNPYLLTRPAWAGLDDAHVYWERALGGGEIGDLCAQGAGAFTTVPGLPYLVQRVWSNQAALAGQDPCVPAPPGEVYVDAAPELDDDIAATVEGRPVTVKGVRIPAGAARTIDVDLFGDPASGAFMVQAVDFGAAMGEPPLLSFALDGTSGEIGQKLHLTITVTRAGNDGTEMFYVVSSRPGEDRRIWVGLVGN